jgi:hypothetical protein
MNNQKINAARKAISSLADESDFEFHMMDHPNEENALTSLASDLNSVLVDDEEAERFDGMS